MRPLSSGSPPCSSATASQPPTSPAERGRSPVAPPRRPGRGRLPVRGLTDAARCPAALGAEVIKVERADPDIAGLERDSALHSALPQPRRDESYGDQYPRRGDRGEGR